MSNLASLLTLEDPTLRFLQVGHFRSVMDGAVSIKTVPYTIIAQVLAGSYEITRLGETAAIRPGEAFLAGANLPLHIVHRGDPDHGGAIEVRYLHVHYTVWEQVDFTSLLELPLVLEERWGGSIGERVAALLDMDDAEARGRLDMAGWVRRRALAMECLAVICGASPPRADMAGRVRELGRLRPALELMRRALAERLRVEDLSRAVHLSPARFHALFRASFGRPPMEYLKLLRLGEARRQLAVTDRLVAEIAEATGFSSPYHLAREFRARFGTPPTAFRAAWRRGDVADPLPEAVSTPAHSPVEEPAEQARWGARPEAMVPGAGRQRWRAGR